MRRGRPTAPCRPVQAISCPGMTGWPLATIRAGSSPTSPSMASRSRSAWQVRRPYSSIRSHRSRRRLAWRPSGQQRRTNWPGPPSSGRSRAGGRAHRQDARPPYRPGPVPTRFGCRSCRHGRRLCGRSTSGISRPRAMQSHGQHIFEPSAREGSCSHCEPPAAPADMTGAERQADRQICVASRTTLSRPMYRPRRSRTTAAVSSRHTAPLAIQNARDITMLLCLSIGFSYLVAWFRFGAGFADNSDTTGMGRSQWRAGFYQVTGSAG